MALSTFAAGRLWGARYGAGRPWVLALPGWGHDHRDFDPVLEGLDAIALDLPGFGVAQEPPAAWSTAEYASFVNPVLDDMAGGPVVVLGHSFGARVAVHLAAGAAPAGTAPAGTAPAGAAPKAAAPTGGVVGPSGTGRVATLILTGAPLAPVPGKRPSGPAPAYRVGRALHRVGLLPGRQMEGLRRKYGSDDYRRASDVMRGVLVKAVGETASGAYLPILRRWVATGGSLELVWGEADQVASLLGAQAGLAGPPAVPAGVTVVPGAGHLITPALASQLRAVLLRCQPGR